MDDIGTLEGMLEIFKKVNGVGKENYFVYGNKDFSTSPEFIRRITGDGPDDFITESTYIWFVLNITESGIGILPLSGIPGMFKFDPKKLKPEINDYIFINFSDVEKVKIKKIMFGNEYKLHFKKINEGQFDFIMPYPFKQLPYQEESINKLIEKYGK